MKFQKNLILFLLISLVTVSGLSGCMKDYSQVENLSGASFETYFENREFYPTGIPEDAVRIVTVKNLIDPCPPEPEGPCGFDAYVLASENWEEKGEGIQVFYIEDQSFENRQIYGPFEDNLSRIVKEAKEMNE